jgi:hypothetical protein
MEWNEQRLQDVRDEHEVWLMQQPFIHGTGIGQDDQGQLCIKIYTDAADAKAYQAVRDHLKGIPLCFEETGPIHAQ